MAGRMSRDEQIAANRQESSVGTISAERKALDLLIQASRADPKLRAAVLEVEKWIARLTDSVAAAEQAVDELESDRDDDYSPAYQDEYQRLWHQAAADRQVLCAALVRAISAIKDCAPCACLTAQAEGNDKCYRCQEIARAEDAAVGARHA